MSCPGVQACCEKPDKTSVVEIWHTADSGMNNAAQASVKALLLNEDAPALILGGDNDYLIPHDYQLSVGNYYSTWYNNGTLYPILGNHDLDLDNGIAFNAFFFAITGGITYYHKSFGPVDFFFIDSGFNTVMEDLEPDGNTIDSIQADWLRSAAATSNAPWKVAVMHHCPYSSDTTHGNTLELQWDFESMGIDIVIAGHNHAYERILLNNVQYIVNGLGGGDKYVFGTPVVGSQFRYSDNFGALKLRFSANSCQFTFKDINGVIVDAHELTK